MPGVGSGQVVIIVDEATYDGQLLLCVAVVDTGLDTKGLVRDRGGGINVTSGSDNALLWGRSLFRGFLSELEWDGVVDVSCWGQSLTGRCQCWF